jgi:uncharacterized protein YjbJ (UPF0337 family)
MSGHKGEALKGKLKVAIGEATGDKGLQREGKVDQASAATKSKVGDVADAIKGVVNHKKS